MKRLFTLLSQAEGNIPFKGVVAALGTIGLGFFLSASELVGFGVVLGLGVAVLAEVRLNAALAPMGGFDHHADFGSLDGRQYHV